jgi:hypothetical protein
MPPKPCHFRVGPTADLAPGAGEIEILRCSGLPPHCGVLSFGAAAQEQGRRRFASIQNDSGPAQEPAGCPVAGPEGAADRPHGSVAGRW